jgi:hypothetical protein
LVAPVASDASRHHSRSLGYSSRIDDQAIFFDPRTGEIRQYHDPHAGGKPQAKMRLSKLGQPLVVEVKNQ